MIFKAIIIKQIDKKKIKHYNNIRRSQDPNNEAIINHLCWFPEGSDMWRCSRQGKHTLAQVAVTNTLADLKRARPDTFKRVMASL